MPLQTLGLEQLKNYPTNGRLKLLFLLKKEQNGLPETEDIKENAPTVEKAVSLRVMIQDLPILMP